MEREKFFHIGINEQGKVGISVGGHQVLEGKKAQFALAGIIAVGTAFGISCGKGELIDISGTVLDENYLPPTPGYLSEYFISLKTPEGIKAIQVENYGGWVSKEAIDVMITEGEKVRVTIPAKSLKDPVLKVPANRIAVLPENETGSKVR